MSDRKKRQATILVEGGRRKEWRGRLVNPPVERASTILFDDVAQLNGGAPGIAANFEMFPESGYTAVALMNTDPPAMMPIAKAIRERIPAK